MDFIPHSTEDRKKMLAAIGVADIQELVNKVIPAKYQFERPLNIPPGLSEFELNGEFGFLSRYNEHAAEVICFMGGGAYDHYIPNAISALASRSEFSTAYTPYQAEVAQGTLQTIYEFQSMICRLTGMDVANASHYDGATALAEAVLLANRKVKRNKVVVPYGLNPNYLAVMETYCKPLGIEIVKLKSDNGTLDLAGLTADIGSACAVVVQQPNFFGLIEDGAKVAEIAHKAGALVIASIYPISLALLKPPAEWGADIVTGEGQSLGIPLSLGGPYVGLFACTKDLVRLMPGRLVARAKDAHNKDGYVLTLQTREQHIRREKATSNICTNQALIALQALIYMSLLGPEGLQRVALNSYRGAHYLAEKLKADYGIKPYFKGEFFNEFVIKLPVSAVTAQNSLIDDEFFVGPLPGKWYPEMENSLLIAVTEKRSIEQLDALAESIGALVTNK